MFNRSNDTALLQKTMSYNHSYKTLLDENKEDEDQNNEVADETPMLPNKMTLGNARASANVIDIRIKEVEKIDLANKLIINSI